MYSIASCSALNLPNGIVSYNGHQMSDSRYPIDTTATFTCNPGYSVDGYLQNICIVSEIGAGNWSHQMPTCRGNDIYIYFTTQLTLVTYSTDSKNIQLVSRALKYILCQFI